METVSIKKKDIIISQPQENCIVLIRRILNPYTDD